MREITPVLLCGGGGTRLWPLSRQSYPKQFAYMTGGQTLFQASAQRMTGEAESYRFQRPHVITTRDFRFIAAEQLYEAGIDPGAILLEPEGRNTAPAILAAALFISAQNPDAILLVSPSDHVVPDVPAFRDAVVRGLTAVEQGNLVTFGITPDHPETGYGYLELPGPPPDDDAPCPLTGFVEKPDQATAQAMLEKGTYLWNAGIFLFAAKDFIAAVQKHAPQLIDPVSEAVTAAMPDLGFLDLDAGAWAGAEEISVDYAVMEKADNLWVVPYSGAWSDLGSWESVLREGTPDSGGVVLSGQAHHIDCTDSLLWSESPGLELVGIGLDNTIAVATPDAVLVADRSRSQDVKQAVALLKSTGARQATEFPMDHRPWGHFETLALADRFQVKRIVVKPGGILSLQSHLHRSEHWIVVAGTALVTIGETEQIVAENESVYVPLGVKHRLENPGKMPMVLIEVQTGSYLGEDDITRHEDVYARSAD